MSKDLTHPEIILNNQPYPIVATRRKGSRRFVIRYNAKKRVVTLTLPMRASLKEGLMFAHKHQPWLQKQTEKSSEHMTLKAGVMIPLLGQNILLQHTEGRGLATYSLPSRGRVREGAVIDTDDNNAPHLTSPLGGEEYLRSSSEAVAQYHLLTIHGDITFFQRRLKDWITKQLKSHITQLATEKATLLGVKFTRIQIRDADHQWGSCSPHGSLSFAFRLAFASSEQLDYIVCHEVAHLKELNHSPRFWKLVEQLCPDYQTHRRWFKTHGHELGKYYFFPNT